jgi:hypothetical protein
MFSYDELEMKYGSALAYQCLIEIEKVTHISSRMVAEVDPETRLANAIRLQDAGANDNAHVN